MNYYRRYVGSYLKKTTKISMIEDGAYTRLLDTYYADEKPLNPGEVYTIARAMNAAERKAVDSVIEKYFRLGEDGLLHNEKADEELGVAIPKMEKQREIGKVNGSKGGRPAKTKVGSEKETNLGSKEKPNLVPEKNQTCNQPSAVSHQPESKPPSEKRFPGREGTSRPEHEPLALAEARLDPATPAAILASVCVANGIRTTAFHPLVVEWAQLGVTTERLKSAIATARMRKGEAVIPVAYLDPILRDDDKPQIKPWKSDDAEAEALCRKLGVKGAKPGEPREVWHQRIEMALAEQARSRVA